MTVEKQDSNIVGFFVAREESNRVLGATPVFVTREPNTFSDFGGEYKSVARRPFNPSRQRKKGSTVDLDANGGWNEDVTQNNMVETIESVCFAASREKMHSVNTAAVAASDDFTVATSVGYLVGHIVFVEGYAAAANNGLHVLNGLTDATHISTADALTDEVAAAEQVIRAVGYQFPAADIVASVVGGTFVLTSAAINPTTLGLIPGEWVFIGGDAAGNQLSAVLTGFARLKLATATTLVFDKTTFAAAGDDGVGTTLRIFFGTVIKNEDDPDLIAKFTHTVERTLGRDDDGRQSEYIDGYVFNELTWNSPLADKVNVDIKGVGMSHNTRTGAEGPVAADAGASITVALGEDAFNTSSNVYRLRMAVLDPATLNPTPLIGRITEWNGKFNNNVSANKAQGTLGGFDSTAGGFDVDLELTGYFGTVAGIATIRENDDCTFDAIYSKDNAAIILDVPLIANGGGRLNVEMDKAIMIPLTSMAAESPFGHTALFVFMPYVPSVGMATG